MRTASGASHRARAAGNAVRGTNPFAPVRIGLLTTSHPHLGEPAAGCFVREMGDALRARGHVVDTVCIARRDGDRWDEPLGDHVHPARYPWGATFYHGGAPDVLGLGGARQPPWQAAVGAPLAVASLAWAARALDHCDALVSHFILPCGLLAGLLRRGRRHVAVAHGTDGWLLARAPRALQARVIAGADLLWCTHRALRDRLAVPPATRCEVRPMGWVEQPAPRTAAATLRVLTLSRLVPLKRVERVIAAVAMLRARGHDVTLTIAGEGPARRALEAAAGEGTRFLGAVDPAARGELFARADVLVHAAGAIGARTEGAPVAVIEAMGHGLAVVACDAGGVRELTADAALLVPDPAEPTALAAALARLDLSRRADLGARARARALPWRWDATAAWLEAALR